MVRNIRRLAREGQHWETRYAYSYLSENADQLKVQIIDSTGKVIQTQDLGAQKAGVINFAWDGKDDAGAAKKRRRGGRRRRTPGDAANPAD